MATLQSTTVANTGTMLLPKGTTAQRPGSPTAGMSRFNTDLNYTEMYTGTDWVPFCTGAGSTINEASVTTSSGLHQTTLSNGYRIHNFLSGSHTFTPGRSGRIEVLVVAGGGAGGWDVGGGGGGGGVVYRDNFEVIAGTGYTVTVGAGGVGQLSGGASTAAVDGSNSVFGSLTALGGGGGANWSGQTGRNGGSGGGTTSNVATRSSATQSTSASGGFGFPGGAGGNNTSPSSASYSGASGGGGAGGFGGDGSATLFRKNDPIYGAGGPGIACDITGITRFYGGGGGACSDDGTTAWGLGGIGGGGAGRGRMGEPHTGGGGGGSGLLGDTWDRTGSGNSGGDGGSGIVIVRYADEAPSVCIVWDQIYNTTQVGWTCPAGVTSVEVLVVGGGGGGGMDMGGGGGAGGVVYNPAFPVTPTTFYAVQVGQGGNGAPRGNADGGQSAVTGNYPDNPNIGSNWGFTTQGQGSHTYSINATAGTNSSFGSLIAVGGGYGGTSYRSAGPGGIPTNGGSGGGASGYNNDGGSRPGGLGTAGQGFAGGAMGVAYYSGGGGGAGGAGAGSNSRPNGGNGLPFSILGPHYYWGGGGGGSGYSSGGGRGGLGGGGGGAIYWNAGGVGGLNPGQDGAESGGFGNNQPNTWGNSPGGNGGRNTGGGGGGGSHYTASNQGGQGGSGFVAIRYTPPQ